MDPEVQLDQQWLLRGSMVTLAWIEDDSYVDRWRLLRGSMMTPVRTSGDPSTDFTQTRLNFISVDKRWRGVWKDRQHLDWLKTESSFTKPIWRSSMMRPKHWPRKEAYFQTIHLGHRIVEIECPNYDLRLILIYWHRMDNWQTYIPEMS